MIVVGDTWINEREGLPFRVTRITCKVHGELRSCRAVLEPDPERPGCALMFTRCPVCGASAQVEVQRAKPDDPDVRGRVMLDPPGRN